MTHTDPVIALSTATNGRYTPDLLARVAWSTISEPGDATRGQLIAEHGAVEALRVVLEDTAGVPEAGELRERAVERFSVDQIVKDLDRRERLGVQIITPEHEHWPTQLDILGLSAPVALWARGTAALLSRNSVALVGARASTVYGEHVLMEFATGLVECGWAIVSGAAYGIDGTAHRATLAAGGDTIAVLAGGVDRYYPSGHDGLLQRIAEAGVVVSELPVGVPPTRWRFLQRNRIIAALARKTVVVEAGSRSGSLNTAGHALNLGRPVGAVPGPVTSVASAGCHCLIREHGATLITTADEAHEL